MTLIHKSKTDKNYNNFATVSKHEADRTNLKWSTRHELQT